MLDDLAEGGWIAARRAKNCRGLSFPPQGRAPAADGRRRANAHAACRPDGVALFARFLGYRIAKLSQMRYWTLNTVQHQYARLFEEAPGRGAACIFTARRRRPRNARQAAEMGFRSPLEIIGDGARWLCRRLSLAAQRVHGAACRNRAAAERPSRAPTIPTPLVRAFDRFSLACTTAARLFSLLRPIPTCSR